jgi:hypothetical protein
VGEVTKYVVNKALCRVIVTAPPARDGGAPPTNGGSKTPPETQQTGARIV